MFSGIALIPVIAPGTSPREYASNEAVSLLKMLFRRKSLSSLAVNSKPSIKVFIPFSCATTNSLEKVPRRCVAAPATAPEVIAAIEVPLWPVFFKSDV